MHLADAFIQSDLVHSGYTFFCQYMCSLRIEPTTFALLTQCSNHWDTGALDVKWDLNETIGYVAMLEIFPF